MGAIGFSHFLGGFEVIATYRNYVWIFLVVSMNRVCVQNKPSIQRFVRHGTLSESRRGRPSSPNSAGSLPREGQTVQVHVSFGCSCGDQFAREGTGTCRKKWKMIKHNSTGSVQCFFKTHVMFLLDVHGFEPFPRSSMRRCQRSAR